MTGCLALSLKSRSQPQYAYRGTVDVATPTVSISADTTTAVFKEDAVTYTLTRTGSTTAALDVTVALTPTKDFLLAADLPQTVTIAAGQSTKTFTVAASSFQHFAAGTKVEGGTLIAVVEDEDGVGGDYDLGTTFSVNVAIVIGATVRIEVASSTVGEAAGTLSVKLIARTGPGAPQPTSNTSSLTFSSANDTAVNGIDYNFSSAGQQFFPSEFSMTSGVWQAEDSFDLTITNDEDDEDDESFILKLEYHLRAPKYPAGGCVRQLLRVRVHGDGDDRRRRWIQPPRLPARPLDRGRKRRRDRRPPPVRCHALAILAEHGEGRLRDYFGRHRHRRRGLLCSSHLHPRHSGGR